MRRAVALCCTSWPVLAVFVATVCNQQRYTTPDAVLVNISSHPVIARMACCTTGKDASTDEITPIRA